jgi:predicted protein tyrosine phosphatase
MCEPENFGILSRYAVEQAESWPEGAALISIRGNGGKPPTIKPIPLLSLCFDDVGSPEELDRRQKQIGATGDWRLHYRPFSEADAKAIVAWVNTFPSLKFLLAHCDAGISRSAGVMAAFLAFYGRDDSEVYRTRRPNAHVKTLVLRALTEQKQRVLP